MKQHVITLAIVGTIVAVFAFAKVDTKSEGAIGDVKYSVLPPDKFKEENGNGWVLMDNKVPIQGSALNTKHGVTEIPDTRGLFIRCLNGTRNDDKADVFKTENNRDRLALEYQPDAIKKHTHNLSNSFGFFGGWGNGNQWSGSTRGNPMAANQPEVSISIKDIGTNLNGEETRPKNIALFTYIKINE
ncbi:MAG: hypothetical protein V5804_03505 [Mucilaginibacter sp.]|uniref:hypothetical protein n=1 Tax=Mucilaginibacter sp. TaxID=1882438 RepID=UPI0034E4E986